MNDFVSEIFSIKTVEQFNELALQAFNCQYNNVEVYADYCRYLGVALSKVEHYTQIPFLPVSFFKTHNIIINNSEPEIVFTSSGTTGTVTSKHPVSDVSIYQQSFTTAFKQFYGNPENYCILALLPSYLERTGSSLVYMAEHLIKQSKYSESGFYLNNYEELRDILVTLEQRGVKIILLGVTYALLELAEKFPVPLNNCIVMETGGMKGRRKEIIRNELHDILKKGLGVKHIHSEYGMTELLSQAYSKGNGVFNTPPWMKIIIRDSYDPFSLVNNGRSGAINIIDLANINSCSFIETSDLGKINPDNSFSILGRFDNSDIRGCNLMVAG